MRRLAIACLGFVVFNCNGFVSEVEIKLGDPDFVVLRSVSAQPLPGKTAATVNQQTYYFDPGQRILDLRQLDPQTARLEQPRPDLYIVSIHTTEEGNQLLGAWTAANINRHLGVFVDNRLISAPVIQSKITDLIVLDGSFTKAEAEEILARLRRGGRR
jgi:preprotein translocase subunit SecD